MACIYNQLKADVWHGYRIDIQNTYLHSLKMMKQKI